MGGVKRGEVYWVNLDPTVGTEIRKTRPGLVISPDDMNAALPRVIVAPLTSRGQPLGCRPSVEFDGKQARILLDQLRAIDKRRWATAWVASVWRYGIRCWCARACAQLPGEWRT